MNRKVLSGLVGVVFFLAVTNVAFGEEMIEKGKTIQFDYTLTINNEVVESTEGKSPIEYIHGEGKIIPGLEKALEGMKVGEEKKVTVAPEEAYGPVIEEAVKDIPKTNFPADFAYEVGMVIELQDPEGNAYPGIVQEIKEEAVVVNFNHPLAGQTLNFDVKIASIK
ncbi:MAG TPA: peptidylprolyl isomerase [Candidatus Omnitrophota bacterium]|nr:peptidylprolyl isomerase [Candidatus Omnitrophota bacterium]